VPLLPELVARLEKERREADEMVQAARATPVDSTFTHAGCIYVRMEGRVRAGRGLPPGQSYDVICQETGERFSVGRVEDDAFWIWAIVETLRHTGLRIEKLLELTHLALISYQLSTTGELVPLLQVVPSKTNGERLLLVTPSWPACSPPSSAGCGTGTTARYRWSRATTTTRPPPGLSSRPVPARLRLRADGDQPDTRPAGPPRGHRQDGVHRPRRRPLRLTPHDFRRIFTTTAVQDGLPLHIASRLLDHRHLNSTQAYVAVFQDDLIRTYRAFVDKRRSVRPPEEYREPTDAEWEEFEKHFALRRVELGSCARPYGSSCEHEHACIRCPMLWVDPAQLERLTDIATSLEERIVEATRTRLGRRSSATPGEPASSEGQLAKQRPDQGPVVLPTSISHTR
jgi:hypothetical protein